MKNFLLTRFYPTPRAGHLLALMSLTHSCLKTVTPRSLVYCSVYTGLLACKAATPGVPEPEQSGSPALWGTSQQLKGTVNNSSQQT